MLAVVTGWLSFPPGHVLSGVPRVAAMCGLKNEPGSSGSTYWTVPFGATLIAPDAFVLAMLYGSESIIAAVKSPASFGYPILYWNCGLMRQPFFVW